MDIDKRQIKSPEDFSQAMEAVQSSVTLLDVFDWDAWLMAEALVRVSNPEVIPLIEKDPQFELKVQVIKAAATYMKTIRHLRANLENPHEG